MCMSVCVHARVSEGPSTDRKMHFRPHIAHSYKGKNGVNEIVT